MLIIALVLGILTLCVFTIYDSSVPTTEMTADLTTVGSFSMTLIILLLVYTVTPMPIYMRVLLGGIYSVVTEFFSGFFASNTESSLIFVRVLLHVAIHAVGIHILIMNEVRSRGTFMKIGQSLLVRRQLEIEKQVKEKMILSVMPPAVAEWLFTEQAHGEESENNDGTLLSSSEEWPLTHPISPRPSNPSEFHIFRPFNMNHMTDVSILFADIVGFTKMSSNKTASQLVGLLNDLFGRFDSLCARVGCEKICTLGDCYYCVSGCPEPREDHALCCAEMGLGMTVAIKEFDADNNEQVDMRVGIHTGTVLCGIVGTKRFKFDVFSNDVTCANKMESTGKPGRVHISAKTHKFLQEKFFFEDGPVVNDMKTYFILGRKEEGNMSGVASYCATWPRRDPGQLTEKRRVTLTTVEDSPVYNENLNVSAYDIMSGKVDILPAMDQEGQLEPGLSEDALSPLPIGLSSRNETLNTSWSTLNSRKDSGIRSCLSSIQAPMLGGEMDENNPLEAHRASGGYFTASPDSSTLDLTQSDSKHWNGPFAELSPDLPIFQHLRKQSDIQLIRCVQQDTYNKDYFLHPPLNPWTLNFTDPTVEKEYRLRVHRYHEAATNVVTFASPKFSTYFDFAIAFLIHLITVIGTLAALHVSDLWIIVCVASTLWYILVLAMCLKHLFPYPRLKNFLQRFSQWTTQWYAWHVCGALLVCIPVISACPCPYGSAFHAFHAEIVMDVLSILFLIIFLNYEFEISYRLSFYGSLLASIQKAKVQSMKNQADYLLNNIIPKHVVEHLKSAQGYSENHVDVGVMFASIVNFHEMYDEAYQGGKEYLRVLNELVGDFDELLDRPEFRNVEKIKTIGSVYMAASGLNPEVRAKNSHQYRHLHELVEFAFEMLEVVNSFNKNLLGFQLVLRVGFHFGEVTAGVIGTTKLYYDIWGDTVNIASRMDSTGVQGRIQVTEKCVNVLTAWYDLEHRGLIYAKGKGEDPSSHEDIFVAVNWPHKTKPSLLRPFHVESARSNEERSTCEEVVPLVDILRVEKSLILQLLDGETDVPFGSCRVAFSHLDGEETRYFPVSDQHGLLIGHLFVCIRSSQTESHAVSPKHLEKLRGVLSDINQNWSSAREGELDRLLTSLKDIREEIGCPLGVPEKVSSSMEVNPTQTMAIKEIPVLPSHSRKIEAVASGRTAPYTSGNFHPRFIKQAASCELEGEGTVVHPQSGAKGQLRFRLAFLPPERREVHFHPGTIHRDIPLIESVKSNPIFVTHETKNAHLPVEPSDNMRVFEKPAEPYLDLPMHPSVLSDHPNWQNVLAAGKIYDPSAKHSSTNIPENHEISLQRPKYLMYLFIHILDGDFPAPADAKELPNLQVVVRLRSRGAVWKSNVQWSTTKPSFNLCLRQPVLGGENLQGTHCSVEVWDQAGPGKEHLLGILLIPLDSLALPLPVILQLENEQFPLLAYDQYLPVTTPETGEEAGTLNMVIGLGTADQIKHFLHPSSTTPITSSLQQVPNHVVQPEVEVKDKEESVPLTAKVVVEKDCQTEIDMPLTELGTNTDQNWMERFLVLARQVNPQSQEVESQSSSMSMIPHDDGPKRGVVREMPEKDSERQMDRTGGAEDIFPALVEIHEAMHLHLVNPGGKICMLYVSIPGGTDVRHEVHFSSLVPSRVDPIWDWKKVEKPLILKVWGGVDAVVRSDDVVLGFVSLDLTTLLHGFNQISGWYDITDIRGRVQGQLRVTVTPMDDKRQRPWLLRTQTPMLPQTFNSHDALGSDSSTRTFQMSQLKKVLDSLNHTIRSLHERHEVMHNSSLPELPVGEIEDVLGSSEDRESLGSQTMSIATQLDSEESLPSLGLSRSDGSPYQNMGNEDTNTPRQLFDTSTQTDLEHELNPPPYYMDPISSVMNQVLFNYGVDMGLGKAYPHAVQYRPSIVGMGAGVKREQMAYGEAAAYPEMPQSGDRSSDVGLRREYLEKSCQMSSCDSQGETSDLCMLEESHPNHEMP
ncbi:unnamed protein product [Darwinula stevensoni]|uniref:adenylate cyclase n=1 Tax=Darwinula stevensoni TaxID=69355 RepID=A0A7R9ADY7_9CRUS|nr:unnamed protein product [Darwinula stevensoni]CAG0901515.1 unnamed protein product [Darwinula stevensoni]